MLHNFTHKIFVVTQTRAYVEKPNIIRDACCEGEFTIITQTRTRQLKHRRTDSDCCEHELPIIMQISMGQEQGTPTSICLRSD